MDLRQERSHRGRSEWIVCVRLVYVLLIYKRKIELNEKAGKILKCNRKLVPKCKTNTKGLDKKNHFLQNIGLKHR